MRRSLRAFTRAGRIGATARRSWSAPAAPGRSLARELSETPGRPGRRLRGRRPAAAPAAASSASRCSAALDDFVPALLESSRADAVLVTIPDAPRERLSVVVAACEEAGVECRFVRREIALAPTAPEIAAGDARPSARPPSALTTGGRLSRVRATVFVCFAFSTPGRRGAALTPTSSRTSSSTRRSPARRGGTRPSARRGEPARFDNLNGARDRAGLAGRRRGHRVREREGDRRASR